MQTKYLKPTTENIAVAGEIIRTGGLVAFPTETVFGLGADAMNEAAVRHVYEAKGRPSDNPMIVHIADMEAMRQLTPSVSDCLARLVAAFWPGPLTVVVPKNDRVPKTTTGGLDTVAVRMPDNPIALALITASGCAIAAPSANLSGRPSPTKTEHVVHDLDGKIEAILEGPDCRVGIESTVVDMTGEVPMILRPGIITAEEIAEATGSEVTFDPTLRRRPTDEERKNPKDFAPKAPGMKYKHYAPKAEMIIFEGTEEAMKAAISEKKAQAETDGKTVGVIFFGEHAFKEAAHDLFADLRKEDEKGVDLILAGALPDRDGIGFAVMNRMLKSAGYHVVKV